MFDMLSEAIRNSYDYCAFIFHRLTTSTYAILLDSLPKALLDTIKMTIISASAAFILGLPLGLLLYCTAKGGLFPNRFVNRVLSIFVDAVRAVPFIILAFYLYQVNRMVVGAGTGINATIFVLIIMATPFFARVAEMSFRGVNAGLIEALRAMGASRLQIITNVLIPESLSSLTTAMTVTFISIISATSLAGFMAGGGLGDLAIRYGYQRYLVEIMNVVILVLIIMNMSVQWLGDKLAKKLDHNNR